MAWPELVQRRPALRAGQPLRWVLCGHLPPPSSRPRGGGLLGTAPPLLTPDEDFPLCSACLAEEKVGVELRGGAGGGQQEQVQLKGSWWGETPDSWGRAPSLPAAPTSLCSNFAFYFKQFGSVASLPSCWVFIVRKIIGNICTDVPAWQFTTGTFTLGTLPAPSLPLAVRGASLKGGITASSPCSQKPQAELGSRKPKMPQAHPEAGLSRPGKGPPLPLQPCPCCRN